VDIVRLDFSTGKTQKVSDSVAEEMPLKLLVNNTHSFVIWCSPQDLKELAVGYLLSEDILRSVDEIENVTLNKRENSCQVKLKAGIDVEDRVNPSRLHTRIVPLIKSSLSPYRRKEATPRVESKLAVRAQVLFDCVNQMNAVAKGFKQTGALHDAAIYEGDGSPVAFAEDVGRHNTVDKVIGMTALSKVDFGRCFMTITGRVPGDMIFKAARVGLPIVASMAAVLYSGIATAQEANMALVGFAREKRMNIYTGSERIII
jgi:formate dehydrogenase accessory protein FdhD